MLFINPLVILKLFESICLTKKIFKNINYWILINRKKKHKNKENQNIDSRNLFNCYFMIMN